MNGQIKESSIAYSDVTRPQKEQFIMPTWALLLCLCIAFYVIKSFIYLKDDKRHGK